jgi:acyl carrier protein
MNRDTLYAIFIEELVNVAPDLEAGTIKKDDQLQDDLELDSMDVLNLVAALHERLGSTSRRMTTSRSRRRQRPRTIWLPGVNSVVHNSDE